MNLAEIGPNIQVKENYRIEFPEEDFLGVCVNAEYGSPAAKFDHPNIASANLVYLNMSIASHDVIVLSSFKCANTFDLCDGFIINSSLD